MPFRPAAAADLEEASRWYENRRPGLGQQFLDAAEAAVRRVLATPEGYEIVYKDRRRALLERFPYSVVVRLIEDQVVMFMRNGIRKCAVIASDAQQSDAC